MSFNQSQLEVFVDELAVPKYCFIVTVGTASFLGIEAATSCTTGEALD